VTTVVESLYATLNSEVDLQNLKIEGARESLHLEFKQKHDTRDGKLHDDDKKNFSAAVSAFANSDGGVLVWGVETKRDSSGHDVVRALKPITDIGDFHSRLGQYLKDAVQPFVEGVVFEEIPGSTPNTGYLRCLIPSSDAMPHRAEHDHEYYKRTAEGTKYRLEHFDLEDLFGRRSRPFLDLEVLCRPCTADREELLFSMQNNGRSIAKNIGFMFSSPDIETNVITGFGFTDLTPQNSQTTFSWSNANLLLHPIPVKTFLGSVTFKRRGLRPVTLKVTWYCENMRFRQREQTFPPRAEASAGAA
jgi:hypothetical protein